MTNRQAQRFPKLHRPLLTPIREHRFTATMGRPHKWASLLCPPLAMFLVSPAAAQTHADTVYTNGRIYTLDAQSSVASSVAVLNGRLIAVGTDAIGRSHIGPKTEVVDLKGAPVVPGIIDSHIHLVEGGAHVGRLSLTDTKTVKAALARIKASAATKKPGEWIVSLAWDPAKQLIEKRPLTAAQLDKVAPHNPVLLNGPVVSANSMAMRIAGIDEKTGSPEGGIIRRHPGGKPTGLFEGTATRLVKSAIPPPTISELAERYAAAMATANSYGLTSVVAAASGAADLRALQDLRHAGRLTLRYAVILPPSTESSPDQWDMQMNMLGVSSGFGDEWLRLDSFGEMPVDGGMTFGTALTRDAYPHDPGYHGVEAISVAKLNATVANGNRHGWRFTLHAIGDAGIDRLLDAYEEAGKQHSIAGRRFVVLRGSLIRKDQLERMKRLGVILQIENMFMWDKAATVEKKMGAAVAHRVFPNRLAIDILGLDNVSQGSDFPTNSMNPWLNLHLAVTRADEHGQRYGADQAIGREEALRQHTISGAYASFEEADKGTLEPGKLADMVVLDRDYMTIPEHDIRNIQVLRTIVGGRTVFSRQ